MPKSHPHLSSSHPLAEVAARRCRAHGGRPGCGIGHVACGRCWERAIRDDERFALECGLPREQRPDPAYISTQLLFCWPCAERRCA
jgi:hypothetical protein